jgi:hypothetical protein
MDKKNNPFVFGQTVPEITDSNTEEPIVVIMDGGLPTNHPFGN